MIQYCTYNFVERESAVCSPPIVIDQLNIVPYGTGRLRQFPIYKSSREFKIAPVRYRGSLVRDLLNWLSTIARRDKEKAKAKAR